MKFEKFQKDFLIKEVSEYLKVFLDRCIVYKVDQNHFEIRAVPQDRTFTSRIILKMVEKELEGMQDDTKAIE